MPDRYSLLTGHDRVPQSTLLGRVGGEERTRGEGRFGELEANRSGMTLTGPPR
jgi:hypothetical protein